MQHASSGWVMAQEVLLKQHRSATELRACNAAAGISEECWMGGEGLRLTRSTFKGIDVDREVFAAASPGQVRRPRRISTYGQMHRANPTNASRGALHILDHFSIGIILLDSVGRILSANASARSVMGNGQRLGPRTSTFEGLPAAASRRMGELIERTQGASKLAMSIPHGAHGGSLMLLASKLRPKEAAQLGRGLQDAATILFLCDSTRPVELPVAWLMDGFGLTLAEARAALPASSGLTVAGMARQLGLSPNTIKTHLRRVFAKTGTSRQAELTRLVASLAMVRDLTPGANP